MYGREFSKHFSKVYTKVSNTENLTFKVTLVRHGQTDANKHGLVVTCTDQPLNDTGREQASLLGKHLRNSKFTKVITSNLMRTYHTAEEILAANENPADYVRDARLNEKSLGEELEGTCGKTFVQQARAVSPNILRYTPPGGETSEAAEERVAAVFQELCQWCLENSDDEHHVLIVTHGLMIMHLMDYFYKHPNFTLVDENHELVAEEIYHTPVHNTSVSNLEVTQLPDSRWKVKLNTFSDVTHLN